MKKTLLLPFAVLVLQVCATATTHTITTANFSFSPVSITTVQVGDTVKWVWANGSHTTTSTNVPAGAASWNSPLNSSNTTFSYVPTVAGTYSYECTPHAPNMAGSFTVTGGTGGGGGGTSPHGIVRNVKVEDYEFKPSSLTVNLGDTIRWFWDEGNHTTTSNAIPAGAVAWNAPINSSSKSFRYVPTVPGTYTYKCLPHASMGMTGSFTVTGSAPTSVGNTSVRPMAAFYPNPVGNSMQVDLTSFSGNVRVAILDASGRMVATHEAIGGKVVAVSVAHLSNGLYVLQTSEGNFMISQRFTVAH